LEPAEVIFVFEIVYTHADFAIVYKTQDAILSQLNNMGLKKILVNTDYSTVYNKTS